MKNVIYFRGGRKGEEIFLQGHYYELSVGGIISDLMDADEEQVLSGAELIEKTLLSGIAAGERPLEDLGKVAKYISGLKLSPLLQDIFLWQPLLAERFWADKRQDEYYLTSFEHDRVNAGVPLSYHLEQMADLRDCSTLPWKMFSDLLSGEQIMDTEEEGLALLRNNAFAYQRHFREMTLSFQRLRTNLREYLGNPTSALNIRKELIRAGQHAGGVFYEDWCRIFPERKGKKYAKVSAAIRLSDLVALELDLMEQSDQHFSCCKLCGRYFVPFSRLGIYCRNPNPLYGGKKCCTVGPILTHQENTKDLPMQAEFLSHCKAYSKWCRENKKDQPDDITQEIENTYKEWKTAAKAAQKAYTKGEISEKELGDALALPPIGKRSELLYRMKDDRQWEKDGVE